MLRMHLPLHRFAPHAWDAIRERIELENSLDGSAANGAAATDEPTSGGTGASEPTGLRPPGLLELEELMADHLDTRVSITMTAKRGKVLIDSPTWRTWNASTDGSSIDRDARDPGPVPRSARPRSCRPTMNLDERVHRPRVQGVVHRVGTTLGKHEAEVQLRRTGSTSRDG